MQLLYSVDIQQRRSVDSQPAIWRELRFQLGNGEIHNVIFARGCSERHFISRVEMSDVSDLDELHTISQAGCDANQIVGLPLRQQTSDLRKKRTDVTAFFAPAENSLKF